MCLADVKASGLHTPLLDIGIDFKHLCHFTEYRGTDGLLAAVRSLTTCSEL